MTDASTNPQKPEWIIHSPGDKDFFHRKPNDDTAYDQVAKRFNAIHWVTSSIRNFKNPNGKKFGLPYEFIRLLEEKFSELEDVNDVLRMENEHLREQVRMAEKLAPVYKAREIKTTDMRAVQPPAETPQKNVTNNQEWRSTFDKYRSLDKVRSNVTWAEFTRNPERNLKFYQNVIGGYATVPNEHKTWEELCRFYSQVKGCDVATAQSLSREELLENLRPKE